MLCEHLRSQEVGWLTGDRSIARPKRVLPCPGLQHSVLDLGRANQLEFLLSSLMGAYDCISSLAPNPHGGSLDGHRVYSFSQ